MAKEMFELTVADLVRAVHADTGGTVTVCGRNGSDDLAWIVVAARGEEAKALSEFTDRLMEGDDASTEFERACADHAFALLNSQDDTQEVSPA